MTTTTSKIALGLLSAVLATALMPASAAGWKVWEGHNEAAPRAILTDTSDRAGAVLVCDPMGKMSAILSMEAGSISDQLDVHATYKRGETALISSGDNSALETTVRYSPANSVIEIESHTPIPSYAANPSPFRSIMPGRWKLFCRSRMRPSRRSQKPAMRPARRMPSSTSGKRASFFDLGLTRRVVA